MACSVHIVLVRAFRFGLGSVYFPAFCSPFGRLRDLRAGVELENSTSKPLARTGVRDKAVDVRSGVIAGPSSERRLTNLLPLHRGAASARSRWPRKSSSEEKCSDNLRSLYWV